MSQNTSHAVMAQRTEPRDSLDYFPTPPWATRALLEHIIRPMGFGSTGESVWEPGCGEGHMARPLAEYFGRVEASDVHDYGFGDVLDFLTCQPGFAPVDWIITNPPFRFAEPFVRTALAQARVGVAVLVRTAFLEGIGRYGSLFSTQRPAVVAQFAERVPMHKGRLVENGSTATAYCWVVWRSAETSTTRFDWIPPCRRKLERAGDYRVCVPAVSDLSADICEGIFA